MRIQLKRLNDAVHFEARNERGGRVVSDGAPDIGGQDLGVRPMEMLLSALGSCSGIDVVLFLRKMRQPLEDISIAIEAEREADVHPALFTAIHLHFELTGALQPKKVEKAISLSVDRYCSVARHLEHTAKLSWSYSLNGEEIPARE